jgi:NAD(P)-dependent dehydrogenase (short-subunit alcohol dehydrogenase family)
VNVLSFNIHCGLPSLAIYSASKGALAVLTKNVANAHKQDRIRVNGIALGWTDTPAEREMQARTLGLGDGWLERAEAEQPFGRLLKPEDVASLAVFLLSDAAGPMTGAIIDQEQRIAGATG